MKFIFKLLVLAVFAQTSVMAGEVYALVTTAGDFVQGIKGTQLYPNETDVIGTLNENNTKKNYLSGIKTIKVYRTSKGGYSLIGQIELIFPSGKIVKIGNKAGNLFKTEEYDVAGRYVYDISGTSIRYRGVETLSKVKFHTSEVVNGWTPPSAPAPAPIPDPDPIPEPDPDPTDDAEIPADGLSSLSIEAGTVINSLEGVYLNGAKTALVGKESTLKSSIPLVGLTYLRVSKRDQGGIPLIGQLEFTYSDGSVVVLGDNTTGILYETDNYDLAERYITGLQGSSINYNDERTVARVHFQTKSYDAEAGTPPEPTTDAGLAPVIESIPADGLTVIDYQAGWVVDSIQGRDADGTTTVQVGKTRTSSKAALLAGVNHIKVSQMFLNGYSVVGSIELTYHDGSVVAIGTKTGGRVYDTKQYDMSSSYITDFTGHYVTYWGGLVSGVTFTIKSLADAPEGNDDDDDDSNNDDGGYSYGDGNDDDDNVTFGGGYDDGNNDDDEDDSSLPIEPNPNNQYIKALVVHSGWLIDSIQAVYADDTSTNVIGGTGGSMERVELDNLRSLEVVRRSLGGIAVASQLVLTYTDGSIVTVSNNLGGSELDVQSYYLEDGEKLMGMQAEHVNLWDGLVSTLSFVVGTPASDGYTYNPGGGNDDDDDLIVQPADNSSFESDGELPFQITVAGTIFGFNQYASSDYTYNYRVDCDSDGVIDAVVTTAAYTCEYDTDTTHLISIYGELPHFRVDSAFAGRLKTIEQWGSIEWKSFYSSFENTAALDAINATDIPNTSNVTNMSRMFMAAAYADSSPDFSQWNVSNVTNMNSTFQSSRLNPLISDWDVSSVVDMSYMFTYAYSFNQDLSDWDVSNVTNMAYMFSQAYKFQGDISTWDVSNVTDMSYMFERMKFIGDLSAWRPTNVTNMHKMFYYASKFDSDLSAWNVGKVTNFMSMFMGARKFSNRDLSGWDVSRALDYRYFDYNWGTGNTLPNWID